MAGPIFGSAFNKYAAGLSTHVAPVASKIVLERASTQAFFFGSLLNAETSSLVTQILLEAQVQAAANARITQHVLETQVQAPALARITQHVLEVQVQSETFSTMQILAGASHLWKLDEIAGTTFADSIDTSGASDISSGSGYTHGDTALSGDIGASTLFAGAGSLTTPLKDPSASAFSVEALIAIAAGGGATQDVIANAVVSADNAGFELQVSDTGACAFKVGNGSAVFTASTATPLSDGTHHIAGVFDGGNVLLYIDGALAASTPFSGAYAGTPRSAIKIGADGA